MRTAVLDRLWIYECLAQLFDADLGHLPEPADAAASSPLVSAAVALRTAVVRSSAEDILADHARLFVNARDGVAAPPYASWYLDGQLLGPSSRFVEQVYSEQGLEPAADAGEPADYVGVELEFLLFLTRHELAASSTGDDDALASVLDLERTFMLNHLARWVPAFVAQIRAAEPGPVFAAAGDLLGAVVQDEARHLSRAGSKAIARQRGE